MWNIYVTKYIVWLRSEYSPSEIIKISRDEHLNKFKEFYEFLMQPFKINPEYLKSNHDTVYNMIKTKLI